MEHTVKYGMEWGKVIYCSSAYLRVVLLKKITFPVNMFIFAQPMPSSILATGVSRLSALVAAS